MCFFIDVVEGNHNCSVACFHCLYTSLMSKPAGVWRLDDLLFWQMKDSLYHFQTLCSFRKVMEEFPKVVDVVYICLISIVWLAAWAHASWSWWQRQCTNSMRWLLLQSALNTSFFPWECCYSIKSHPHKLVNLYILLLQAIHPNRVDGRSISLEQFP